MCRVMETIQMLFVKGMPPTVVATFIVQLLGHNSNGEPLPAN